MAYVSDYRTIDWLNRRPWLAVFLSLLLHGLLVTMFLLEPWAWSNRPAPPQILAEFVLPEPPKPAPAPPRQRQAAATQEAPPLPPASVPQLQRAPVTEEESKSSPSPGDRARSQPRSAPEPEPQRQPRPDLQGPNRTAIPPLRQPQPQRERQAGSTAPGQGRAAGAPGDTMTQSESDFFLSQIVTAWPIDFDAPQFSDIQIYGHYKMLADGTLAPPFGRNDPWDMEAMVNNWDEIADAPGAKAAAYRTAIQTFLRAMRLAQPFAMPPDAEGYPKILSLNFRIGDL